MEELRIEIEKLKKRNERLKSKVSILETMIEDKTREIYERNEALRIARDDAESNAKVKEEFLANMSHEIRTPLNGIIGLIDILKSDQNLCPEYKESIQIIHQSSDHLLNIVNDILDLSKMEKGSLSVRNETFVINSWLNEIRELYSASALSKNISLRCEWDETLSIMCDGPKGRLSQVLSNLVANAIKFTETGEVVIKAQIKLKTKNVVCVVVQIVDTGIGIDPLQSKMLFQPFQQLDQTSTKAYKGSGLGLAISSKIMEHLGGTIEMDSELGKGSTFQITFDLKVVGGSELFEKAPTEIQNDIGLNILLVEDQDVNIFVAKSILENLNCTVEIAKNGKIAVEIFDPNKFDLVLMDIQMPVLNGVDATKMIKEKFQNVCPIVALSANALDGDKDKYIASGLDDYLAKPVTIESLRNILLKWK